MTRVSPLQKANHNPSPSFSEALITVAMVTHNDADIIRNVLSETTSVLTQNYIYYELLIIDNGSTDGTTDIIRDFQKNFPNIRLLVLSRMYDQEIGFAAALDNSLGDYVVLLNLTYDPPTMIPALVTQAMSGFDIVIAERKDRSDNTFFEKCFARLFYRLCSAVLGFHFSPNASYFRVLSRRAVNAVTQIKNKSRYLKYFNALVGLRHHALPYERIYRRPIEQTKIGLFQSLCRALDILLSNSIFPLRAVSFLGVIASFLSLLFLIYVFVVSLMKTEIAEGWITTSVISGSMFFLLFLILTVMSEYITRILIETKNHPLYFIAEESMSAVLDPDKEKLNVV